MVFIGKMRMDIFISICFTLCAKKISDEMSTGFEFISIITTLYSSTIQELFRNIYSFRPQILHAILAKRIIR
jgi:hypothetical protein